MTAINCMAMKEGRGIVDFRFKAGDLFDLPESSIQEMAFSPTPDNLPGRRNVQSVRVTGSIAVPPASEGRDETLAVAKWAQASAYEPEAYQRVEAAVRSKGGDLRHIDIPSAFVVSYSERFSVGSDKGTFEITVREYTDKAREKSAVPVPGAVVSLLGNFLAGNALLASHREMEELIQDSAWQFTSRRRRLETKLDETLELLRRASSVIAELEETDSALADELRSGRKDAYGVYVNAEDAYDNAMAKIRAAKDAIEKWSMEESPSKLLEENVKDSIMAAIDAIIVAEELADAALSAANAAAIEAANALSERADNHAEALIEEETPIVDDMYNDLTEEQKLFVATIAGEAIGQGPTAWATIAYAIMNRVDDTIHEWYNLHTVTAVIQSPQAFSSYYGQSTQYLRALNYLNNRTWDNEDYEKLIYEELINVVLPIYNRESQDITGGVQIFYSPNAMSTPGSRPEYEYEKLEEIIIPGIDSWDFRFFKYR